MNHKLFRLKAYPKRGSWKHAATHVWAKEQHKSWPWPGLDLQTTAANESKDEIAFEAGV